MKNKLRVIAINSVLLILFAALGSISYAQTEGFNVKTPIEKISDAATKFLKNIIDDAMKEPKKSIPMDMVCSAECFLVIPEIEIVQSRGDYAGTGLLACHVPNSDTFTEPLFFKINQLKSFYEGGGGLVILIMDKEGMETILADEINLTSDNTCAGKIGTTNNENKTSFLAYAKLKNQQLEGYDLSGSLLEYSSRDTFNAYQGTVVPIEILISPKDVPPVLRDFDSVLVEWTKSCK